MNKIIKRGLLVLTASLTLISTACASRPTPYETNDADGYTVSVRFDANGGIFETNTSIINDSYSLDGIEKNSDGMVEIPLLSPDDDARGNDSFDATMKDHFLAGWYAKRTENADGTYSYSEKWDFENGMLEVDPSKTYSSASPVLTLYAVWAPLFEIRFHNVGTEETAESYVFDPRETKSIKLPEWSKESGMLELYEFPEREGYTLKNVYRDPECTQLVTESELVHPGKLNEDGTVENNILDLYLDWDEGEWYHIYNAEQFKELASTVGNYVICNDLDFTDVIWPNKFATGSFNGTINGNGFKFSNVSVIQTDANEMNVGIFGKIGADATISDVTFDSPIFTVKGGMRKAGSQYGLLAGNASEEATLSGITLINGVINIDSSANFGTPDYLIGLVCGNGELEAVTAENITCVAVGDAPETLTITVDGNYVTVEKAQ